METSSEHHSSSDNTLGEPILPEPFSAEDTLAPGIPIVRSSTPRPLSFESLLSHVEQRQSQQEALTGTTASDFPIEAPVAPPLPEEFRDGADDAILTIGSTPLPLPGKSEVSNKLSSEFAWLFEYGLEMDASILNSPERLDGLALLYGPAVLKGYRLAFEAVEFQTGKVVVTILPSNAQEGEVWGVLYRIPRRLTEQLGDEECLLNRIHGPKVFHAVEVVVQETYRKREITCMTYIASAAAREQFHLLPTEQQGVDAAYVQRLLECARQQKLPEDYLKKLALSSPSRVEVPPAASPLPIEHNTEPIPVLTEKADIPPASTALPDTLPRTPSYPSLQQDFVSTAKESQGSRLQRTDGGGRTMRGERTSQTGQQVHWLMAFAIYLVLLLFIAVALSVISGLGFWSSIFTSSFTPLEVPWFVLLYGLLGGCISSIISLGRMHSSIPPGFVMVTWFTRPFIGAILAALSYLVLNSGLFASAGSIEQHSTLFSVVGALAGFCEGWILFRQR